MLTPETHCHCRAGPTVCQSGKLESASKILKRGNRQLRRMGLMMICMTFLELSQWSMLRDVCREIIENHAR